MTSEQLEEIQLFLKFEGLINNPADNLQGLKIQIKEEIKKEINNNLEVICETSAFKRYIKFIKLGRIVPRWYTKNKDENKLLNAICMLYAIKTTLQMKAGSEWNILHRKTIAK